MRRYDWLFQELSIDKISNGRDTLSHVITIKYSIGFENGDVRFEVNVRIYL